MNNSGNEYEMVTANNYVSDEQIARKNWKPIDDVPAVIFAKVGAAIMLNRKRLCRFPFLLDNNTMAYKFDKSWDKFQIPLPFSTVGIYLGEPLYIEKNLDASVANEQITHAIHAAQRQAATLLEVR